MTEVTKTPAPGNGERMNEMHKLLADTNEAHFALWEAAGWIACAVIAAMFLGGVALVLRETGRAYRGRR